MITYGCANTIIYFVGLGENQSTIGQLSHIDECGAVDGMRELAGETKVLAENQLQCHSVHHKSHMNWHRIETGPPTNRLSYGKACFP
jgi:hypothetical protein